MWVNEIEQSKNTSIHLWPVDFQQGCQNHSKGKE